MHVTRQEFRPSITLEFTASLAFPNLLLTVRSLLQCSFLRRTQQHTLCPVAAEFRRRTSCPRDWKKLWSARFGRPPKSAQDGERSQQLRLSKIVLLEGLQQTASVLPLKWNLASPHLPQEVLGLVLPNRTERLHGALQV